ncbi:hypothetical protein CPB83DRAFT_886742 [Crepidotus variabilis]|uniref:AB hydrolase-1 domain-containing protein n=1 Tax=Crepidotus variabilis TaxID=179855 RepID=A0A9P6JKF8_9AGAR|nr:hypothetical protein CPB83DRAFT_886742 [Crepidotus variabilis]
MVSQNVAVLPSGLELAYTDSGAVSGSSNYTTLILVHGCGFNARTFETLHDHAATFNLRTIAFQRRDYPGSTPFTDDEITEIQQGSEEYLSKTQNMMIDFIRYVVEKLSIPAIWKLSGQEAGKLDGGIALLGWSLGSYFPLALFSNPERVTPESRKILGKYLRSLIIYDSPYVALGFPLPSIKPSAGEEESVSPSDFPAAVSSYFDQPDNWAGDLDQLDQRSKTEKNIWSDWTEEQRNKYVTMSTLLRCEFPTFAGPIQAHFLKNTQKALYDETLAQEYLPDLSIGVLSVGRTLWYCRWMMWHLVQTNREKLDEGKKIRELKTAHLQQYSHLAHMEDPVLFLVQRYKMQSCCVLGFWSFFVPFKEPRILTLSERNVKSKWLSWLSSAGRVGKFPDRRSVIQH